MVLLVAGGIGFAIWWYWNAEEPTSTAVCSFIVQGHPPKTVFDLNYAGISGDRQVDDYRATMGASLDSFKVVQAALSNPELKDCSLLLSAESPSDWLQEHLEVEFAENSELMTVKLHGPVGQEDQLVVILNAIADAFANEVIHKNRYERSEYQQSLVGAANELREDLEQKLVRLEELKAKGADDIDTKISVRMRQREIELDMEFLDELERETKALEIYDLGGAVVELYESAYIDSDDEELSFTERSED
ncbi:GumC domain-containing protein [Aeoliella mucimassa]|uniref:hypothetical protein n=1 Tax=Aeoliella mucimassa TaxID=2527972 RepID=UPI0011A8C35E|nr:hypothetical protein [Aeoliella mucimassa]